MNVIGLLAHVPWPLLAGLLAANVVPYVSALLTKAPGWWTGVCTAVLSFVDGVLSVLANSGTPVNWRAVLGTAFASWIVAAVHHSKILSGTSVETSLHSALSNLPKITVTKRATTVPTDAGVAGALLVIVVVIALLGMFLGFALHPVWFLLLLVLILLVVG